MNMLPCFFFLLLPLVFLFLLCCPLLDPKSCSIEPRNQLSRSHLYFYSERASSIVDMTALEGEAVASLCVLAPGRKGVNGQIGAVLWLAVPSYPALDVMLAI